MHTPIKTWVGTVIIIIIAITVGALVWLYEKNQSEIVQQQPIQNQKACPMDAKVCPDGSAVSRTGPNCEFAECSESLINPQVNCICEDRCGDGICQEAEQGTVCPCGETKESCPQDCKSSLVNTSDWQIYRNEKYGFEFQYPSEWKSKIYDKINTVEFYKGDPSFVDSTRLSVGVDEGKGKNLNLKEYVLQDIKDNNCPGELQEQNPDCPEKGSVDHIIRENNHGVLYTLSCSATSENYIYITKNSKNDLVSFSYQNDFGDWCESQKIEKFNRILSTFKFIN